MLYSRSSLLKCAMQTYSLQSPNLLIMPTLNFNYPVTLAVGLHVLQAKTIMVTLKM